VPLSDAQTAKLSGKLQMLTGKKVSLTNKVDPACMGGVRLDYDGKRVDGTVSNRLEKLGSLLKNTVL
jgi:F-type H+-transporting ATPase subunit delta